MNDTTRELGGALGVAVLGSLVTSRYGSSLASALEGVTAPVREIARSGLAGAVALADRPEEFPGLRLAPGAGDSIKAAAQQAFVDGLGVAALVGAVVVALAAVAVVRLLPDERGAVVPVGEPAGAARPEEVVPAGATSGGSASPSG
jgi:hypothetical protein